MDGKMYGYIRVSTKEQNEARQWIAMEKFGVARRQIFSDRQSGKDFARPAYQNLMKILRPGDTVVVKSVDRLGRNYAEVLEQWRVITKEKGAAVVVLDTPILDTRQHRDLVGTLIADIILAVFSCVAEMERTFNRQRQAEGIAAAKARGVRLGRKKMVQKMGYTLRIDELALLQLSKKYVHPLVKRRGINPIDVEYGIVGFHGNYL